MEVAMKLVMVNTVNKASVPLLALVTMVIVALVAKIRATIEAQTPEGYEDGTGFHFGSPDHED
jgi:hypothetical protein